MNKLDYQTSAECRLQLIGEIIKMTSWEVQWKLYAMLDDAAISVNHFKHEDTTLTFAFADK
jgi:hypothetical protein